MCSLSHIYLPRCRISISVPVFTSQKCTPKLYANSPGANITLRPKLQPWSMLSAAPERRQSLPLSAEQSCQNEGFWVYPSNSAGPASLGCKDDKQETYGAFKFSMKLCSSSSIWKLRGIQNLFSALEPCLSCCELSLSSGCYRYQLPAH